MLASSLTVFEVPLPGGSSHPSLGTGTASCSDRQLAVSRVKKLLLRDGSPVTLRPNLHFYLTKENCHLKEEAQELGASPSPANSARGGTGLPLTGRVTRMTGIISLFLSFPVCEIG